MSVILISNVFRYFCRDELETISNTSRFIQRLIEHKFPAHPFRVFDQLSICANEGDDLKLRLMNGYALLLQDHSNIEEFKERISHSEELDDSTCLQIDEMQPFLGLSVRIKETIIWLLPHSSITPQHILAMEKISHLWTDRRLQINSFSGPENSQTIANDCGLIFKSADIIRKCSQLSIWGIDMPFSDFPNLYKPQAIKFIRFVTSQISPSHLLDFIKGIAENRYKIIVFFELADNFVETHIAKIRADFASASEAVLYKVFFVQPENARDIFQFRDENQDTKEILELRTATNSDFCCLSRNKEYSFVASSNVYCLDRKYV